MKKAQFVILDTRFANLYSVHNALKAISIDAKIISKPEELAEADVCIFPGVGSFKQVIDEIESIGIHDALLEFINSGKPFLGICLGMQLLLSKGSEGSKPSEGLKIFDGEVLALPKDKITYIPHIGWNKLLDVDLYDPLFKGLSLENLYFYFVHSYFCQPENAKSVLATTDVENNNKVPVIIKKDNIYGVQFHPERSGKIGLAMLKNFCDNAILL